MMKPSSDFAARQKILNDAGAAKTVAIWNLQGDMLSEIESAVITMAGEISELVKLPQVFILSNWKKEMRVKPFETVSASIEGSLQKKSEAL
jgi:hypothetical protein